MIWAILIFIGIPLWLIAMMLYLLLRTRSKVRAIPGAVSCKVRSAGDVIPGVGADFARYTSTAHWVHDVLLLHGGTFLIRTTPIGVAALSTGPTAIEPTSRTKRFTSPVSLVLRTDSGAEFELVCAASDADRLRGPFAP